jgi:L-asparagine transporter-like permease
MSTNMNTEVPPADRGLASQQTAASAPHQAPASQSAASTMASALVTGCVIIGPVLSILGCVGLTLPQTAELHQIAAALVTAALVLVMLAIAVAQLVCTRRRAADSRTR